MEIDLNPDQAVLVQAAEQIAADHARAPATGTGIAYSAELQQALATAGFAEVMLSAPYGPLEAALLCDVFARLPVLAEVSVSFLVAPAVLGTAIDGPIALVEHVARPSRFLDVARHAFVLDGDSAVLIGVPRGNVTRVSGMFAYPLGRFATPPDLTAGRRLSADEAVKLRRWWRIAIALEAGAAMIAATAFTVDYVSTRRQFNQPIGAFQAVQHRIARATVHGQATRLLALEAAAKGDALTASLAAVYATRHIGSTVEDLHQFNGALGLTLDHALHYWTYRMLALQSELGGLGGHASAAAETVWGADARPPLPAPEAATAYGAEGW